MPIARFSTFELVLLQSHQQADTATLLLLAWVLDHCTTLTPHQRYWRLARKAEGLAHGHDLAPLLRIAGQRDTHAVQLAAEVLHRQCSAEQGHGIIQKAIALAVENGRLSPANHYILRFLADLLGIPPAMLETLFQALTGSALPPPDDPSREAYWRARNTAYYRRQAERDAEQARAQQQREQEQEQARQHQQKERERRERHGRASAAAPDRTLQALAILGLDPGASRRDIRRAYRRMAQLHHPDRFFAESEQATARASQRFQRIKKAYDYLMQRTPA